VPKRATQAGWIRVLLFLVIVTVVAAAGVMYAAQTGRIQLTNLPLPLLNNQSATLSGTVSIGPSSPVCISGQPCSRVLANYMLEARDASGNLAATTKTDSNGDYTMNLAPGTYTISTLPKVGIGEPGRQVTVKSGANHFDIVFDTGLR